MHGASRRSGKPPHSDLSRRALLSGLGASVALYPFLPLLEREARGAAGKPPTRVVLLFSSNGSLEEKWRPIGTPGGNFDLNEMMLPLASNKDKLVVLDGLRIEHRTEDPGDGHQQGIAKLWTGSTLVKDPASGEPWAGGLSVDQAVANAVGGQTPFKSLEFGALASFRQSGSTIFSRMCYAGARQPLSPVEDPTQMFARLFANVAEGGQDQLERIRAERRSVLDLVKDDLSALQPKYSAADRIKLDAHLTAIRELEARNNAPATVCSPPRHGEQLDPNGNDNLPKISRMMIEQLVMSLTCDLTRVASLQWSSCGSIEEYGWLIPELSNQSVLDITTDKVGVPHHHGIGHMDDSDPRMTTWLTKIQSFYASELNYMLALMAAVPEGDGTLLDNTVIIWGNELARGNAHSKYPMPFLMAGGGGGKIPMGRFMDFGDVNHQRLLVSLCQIMGVDVSTFGNEDTGSGPLTGLLA